MVFVGGLSHTASWEELVSLQDTLRYYTEFPCAAIQLRARGGS